MQAPTFKFIAGLLFCITYSLHSYADIVASVAFSNGGKTASFTFSGDTSNLTTPNFNTDTLFFEFNNPPAQVQQISISIPDNIQGSITVDGVEINKPTVVWWDNPGTTLAYQASNDYGMKFDFDFVSKFNQGDISGTITMEYATALTIANQPFSATAYWGTENADGSGKGSSIGVGVPEPKNYAFVIACILIAGLARRAIPLPRWLSSVRKLKGE